MDEKLISSNMQQEEASAQVVRPKYQFHPPAYLKDYDLRTVRQRQVIQPVLPHTTELRQGLGDVAENIPSPFSRVSSPISQGPWDTLDEWPVENEHSFQNMDDMERQPPCPSYALVQPIHHPQPSPYHRPWEVQQCTPLPQTSYTTQDRLPMRHETASYHQGTTLSPSMLQPTYAQQRQIVYSTAPSLRPPQHFPFTTRGSSFSLNQWTVNQNLPNPAEESTADPQGDSNMLGILGKMMGEL